MSYEINLFTQTQAIGENLLKIIKITQKIAVIFLSFFILLVLIFYSTQYIYTSKIKGIQQKIDSARVDIQKEKATEGMYLAFYQKLISVDNLVKSRFMPTTIIKEIKKALPEDAAITAMNLSPESVSLSIEISSLDSLQKVIAGLQNQTTLPISEINLSGIDKVKDKYQLKFVINFKSGDKLKKT